MTSLSNATDAEQPLLDAGESETVPAETSEKPPDFANASPFPNCRKEKDTVATLVLTVAALAIVAFLVSMLGLLQIRGPL